MKLCWKSMLRKGLVASTLSEMSFAVFGLGDSGYIKFNVVAKKLDRRLEQLGGIRLIEKGLGDEQVSTRDSSVVCSRFCPRCRRTARRCNTHCSSTRRASPARAGHQRLRGCTGSLDGLPLQRAGRAVPVRTCRRPRTSARPMPLLCHHIRPADARGQPNQ